MAHEAIRDSTMVKALGDLYTDISDLVSKEARLARAELKQALSSGVQAGIWMAVAGLLAWIVALLLVGAAVFAIAALGIAIYWSCLIVAAILAAAAAGAFFYGRSLARERLTPTRTLNQINRDIVTAREQLR